MKSSAKQTASFLLFAFVLCSAYGQVSTDKLGQIDEYIENARIQWETPGLAVAIVKDGQILLSKGYGEKKISSGDIVNEKTIFSVGSTTKAMTAAALAMLIDEGKAGWNDKVIDHMPYFQLHDSYATRELRVKDLFTHNAGVGNADLLWALFDHSPEEIVRRLRYFEPSYTFRGGYTYQNIMYAAAGLLIEKLSGMTWAEFIKKRIFEPLGMNHTVALRREAMQIENRSIAHDYVNGKVSPVLDSNADRIGAAGSVWSCTDDMAKWMIFVLDSAQVDGQRLISKESFTILHQPHVIIPRSNFYPTASLTKPNFTTYALGWFQHDYQGDFVHFHTGSLNGTVAIIGLLPEHDLGVYVFGNLDHTEVRHALMYKVFDVFQDNPPRDWSSEFKSLYDGFKQASENRRNQLKEERLPNTSPSRDLEKYTGSFVNERLGSVDISMKDDGQFNIQFREDRNMTLSHWHYDTFLAKIDEYIQDQGNLVSFHSNHDGVESITIYGYEFTKVE